MLISWIRNYEKPNEKDSKLSLLILVFIHLIGAALGLAMLAHVSYFCFLAYNYPGWDFIDFSKPYTWFLLFFNNKHLSVMALAGIVILALFVYLMKCDVKKIRLKFIKRGE